MVGLQETDFEVVQDGRFVQVTESSEVVFPHQDVRVTEEGEEVALRTDGIVQRLRRDDTNTQLIQSEAQTERL